MWHKCIINKYAMDTLMQSNWCNCILYKNGSNLFIFFDKSGNNPLLFSASQKFARLIFTLKSTFTNQNKRLSEANVSFWVFLNFLLTSISSCVHSCIPATLLLSVSYYKFVNGLLIYCTSSLCQTSLTSYWFGICRMTKWWKFWWETGLFLFLFFGLCNYAIYNQRSFFPFLTVYPPRQQHP